MSGDNKDEQIAQFQSITGVDDTERATFFLESSNWNVELAVSSFFEDDPVSSMEATSEAAAAPAPAESMETEDKSNPSDTKGKTCIISKINITTHCA